MSKKIIGVTVGTTLPKPDFNQTDSSKGDYIKNKPDFNGLNERIDSIDTEILALKTSKADSTHDHNDKYYTESEIDAKLNEKSDKLTLNSHTENSDIHVTTTNKSNWNNAYAHCQSTHARTDATKVEDSATNGNIKINGTETNVYSHPNSLVNAGTYKSVTVDAQGHITAGSNPTTISGFGITNAYTKGEVDAKLKDKQDYIDDALGSKSDSNHNHDDKYDAKGLAADALVSANSYTDSKVYDLASTLVVDSKIATHNASDSAHNDIRGLISGLTTRLNTLADSDDTTLDQMSEVVAYIKSNKSLIDGITTNKVNVSDIVNNLTTNNAKKPLSAAQGSVLQQQIELLVNELSNHNHNSEYYTEAEIDVKLTEKADSSHGTHVSYSTTAPVMDGTASVGSATTVARSDHKHPTDTTRAAQSSLDSHVNESTHITSSERTTWNDKAPKNHASTATTYGIGTDSNYGHVKLSDSTSSTSSTSGGIAATPKAVKSAYDLANTAKTNAATAQAKADSAYELADSKAAATHDHNDKYYTESEINTKLSTKANTSDIPTVYTANQCTTFTSDSGTCTPAAVKKSATMFAVPRVTSTDKAITRFNGATGDVQNSKIIIEDVTNTKDTSKKAQVLAIPAEGGKKMVYGYCTDQVDGTSFIGGVFDASATSYPYSAGLAIGGTSGNLLWKGAKVATESEVDAKLNGKANSSHNHTTLTSVTSISNGSGELRISDTTLGLSFGTVLLKNNPVNAMEAATKNYVDTQVSGKSDTSHTHKYAGSSSAGGSATSAVKLDSNAGSTTQPVYFSGGKPVATTYTLGASVPSGAKFTDTTYSVATQSANGLMSASDKTKLDGISATQIFAIYGVALTFDANGQATHSNANFKANKTAVICSRRAGSVQNDIFSVQPYDGYVKISSTASKSVTINVNIIGVNPA